MSYEKLLSKFDDYGWFQKRSVYLFLLPIAIIEPLYFQANYFITAEPNYYLCSTPQLANFTVEDQKRLVSPFKNESKKYDACFRYDVDYDRVAKIGSLPNGTLSVKQCDAWTYDESQFGENAVSYVSD